MSSKRIAVSRWCHPGRIFKYRIKGGFTRKATVESDCFNRIRIILVRQHFLDFFHSKMVYILKKILTDYSIQYFCQLIFRYF